MTADFNKPQITDNYVSVLQSVRELISDLAKGLDSTNTLNVPIDAIRWSSANNRFEKFNGTVWNPLTSQYNIDVVSVSGKAPSNSSGGLSINNGLLNTNLNSQFFDGLSSSAFSKSSSSLNQSVIAGDTRTSNHLPQDRSPGTFFDFRSNTVDSLSDGGTYHRVISFHANSTGSDFLGNKSNQLAFTENNNVWSRFGTDSTWGSWTKLLSDANFDSTIGSGARNIISPSSKGSFKLRNSVGGFSGIEFASGVGSDGLSLLTKDAQTGEYDVVNSAWKWRWDNGTLNVGTVPWSRITGAPTIPPTVPSTPTSVGAIISGYTLDVDGYIVYGFGDEVQITYHVLNNPDGVRLFIPSSNGVSGVATGSTWRMLGLTVDIAQGTPTSAPISLWQRVS